MKGNEAADDKLRRQSAWLARATLLIMLLLAALILLSIRLAIVASSTNRLAGADAAARLALQWLPTFFYLWGLWAIWRIFRDVARGALFGTAIGGGLNQLGWALIGGSLASAVAVPNLLRWSIEAGLIAGSTRPLAGLFHFDAAYMTLGPLGGALLLLARLIARAAEYKSESEKLRSELDGFL